MIPLLSQPVRLGLIYTAIVQDPPRRSSGSTQGIYNTLDIGLAHRLFGSERDFLRFLARNATYHPIGKKLVLARSTSFGDIYAFNFKGDPLTAIPLPERFFGGGGTSHRGFNENQAGPRDLPTGFPLGGTALLFNQPELRFPLIGEISAECFFTIWEHLFELEQLLAAAEAARPAGFRLHGARRGAWHPLPHTHRALPRGPGLQHQSAIFHGFKADNQQDLVNAGVIRV